jgi:hypothetical protein
MCFSLSSSDRRPGEASLDGDRRPWRRTVTDLVQREQRGAVVLLTLNRPDALNALDRDTLEALLAAVETVGADAGVREPTLRRCEA